MSCDFAVWFTRRRLSDEEAGKLYQDLCSGVLEGVEASPSIDAFYAELTARHPEIDDVTEDRIDDTDFCPWSCSIDRSPGHVIMSCVWSKADRVERLIREIARCHHLAVFDPQTGRISYPG